MTTTAPPPPPEADLFPPLLKCAAVAAAGQLDVFAKLADGPQSIAELAEATASSVLGMTQLIEALVATGYVVRDGDRFRNGAPAACWLTPAGVADFSGLLHVIGDFWGRFGDLAEHVRRGGPAVSAYQMMEERPDAGRSFAAYMRAVASLSAPTLVELIPMPSSDCRLLDLGGSHGLHAAAFCKRYPDLEAVILDLPSALTGTSDVLQSEGVADRVRIQPGDFLCDDLGDGFDVVTLFGIVDGNSPDDNARLLSKVASALRPGGQVIIHSHLRSEPPSPFNAIFSLIMFIMYGARTYSHPEITAWLANAGLTEIRRVDVPPTNMTSLTIATLA